MVLEAMVANCINRTSEQEQRLEFLKNIKVDNSANSNSYVKSYSDNSVREEDIPEGKFVYDYRFIGYSDAELKGVFNELSLKNKTNH